MRMSFVSPLRALPLLFAGAGCTMSASDAPSAGDGDAHSALNCDASSPFVGQTAVLAQHFHGVSGTAQIVDDCTIEIRDFHFDGGGLDVHVYGAADPAFQSGIVLSDDLRRLGGYAGETLTVHLPAGVTLDQVRYLSIWCRTLQISFADGMFE